MLTYKQAYDKIIDAYFKDEIRAMDTNFCFCGTLNNGAGWRKGNNLYSAKEFSDMEFALMHTTNLNDGDNDYNPSFDEYNEKYETALFAGMSAALDVLKQIHIERGEVIDEVPIFSKRILKPSAVG